MVQKEPKKRGRPRAYDPDVALARAMDAFWERGYAATSLDEISAATGMNRPSLYAAFGDKHAIYMKAVERYCSEVRRLADKVLAPDRPLRDGLRQFYREALSTYLSETHGARGCFVIGTAATEAVRDPDARGALAGIIEAIDLALEARLRLARERGELASDADPATLTRIASAALFSLAVRARAGESRTELEKTAEAAIVSICGAERQSVPFSWREKVPSGFAGGRMRGYDGDE